MRIFITINNILRSLMLLSLALVATGCLRSDLSDCPADSFSVIVKAVDPVGGDISGQVSDVLLYIFDGQSKFIRKIETTIGSIVPVNEAVGSQITVVAWGNAKGTDNVLPAEVLGADISSFAMSAAKSSTRAAESYRPAADLFLGNVTVNVSNSSATIPIVMRRAIGTVGVKATKLKQYAGFTDDDYSVVIRDVSCALDFDGNPIGEKHYVRSIGAFDAQSVYTIESFNLFSQPTGIAVEIYHGNDLVYRIERDSNNLPLVVEAEKHLNIEIDFGGTITVSATLESWEDNEINKG